MNLKTLQNAAKKVERIKELDAEIIQIDKMALAIANEDVKIKFKIEVEKAAPQEESKVVFDEDGSLISNPVKSWYDRMMLPSIVMCRGEDKKEKKSESEIKETITENIALLMLGVLLQQKTEERQRLLNQLQSKGITI